MHTKPRGANHLLDTMVSLSAFGWQGWELAIRCWRSRGTGVLGWDSRDQIRSSWILLADLAVRAWVNFHRKKKKIIILQSCVPGFDLKGVGAHTASRTCTCVVFWGFARCFLPRVALFMPAQLLPRIVHYCRGQQVHAKHSTYLICTIYWGEFYLLFFINVKQ